jgi:hypothetical protein
MTTSTTTSTLLCLLLRSESSVTRRRVTSILASYSNNAVFLNRSPLAASTSQYERIPRPLHRLARSSRRRCDLHITAAISSPTRSHRHRTRMPQLSKVRRSLRHGHRGPQIGTWMAAPAPPAATPPPAVTVRLLGASIVDHDMPVEVLAKFHPRAEPGADGTPSNARRCDAVTVPCGGDSLAVCGLRAAFIRGLPV